MARNKNLISQHLGKSAPKLGGYTAQRVPHVGPQRQESEGSNYRRLASALGDFASGLERGSNALMAGFEAADRKAQKDESNLLTSIAQGEFSSDVRHEANVQTGYDPIISKLRNVHDAKAHLLPQLQKDNQAWLDNLEANQYREKVKEGEEFYTEDGTLLQAGDTKFFWTPDMIKDRLLKQAKDLDTAIPSGLSDSRAIKQMLGTENHNFTKKSLAKLDIYRRKERQVNYERFVNTDAPEVLVNEFAEKGAEGLTTRFTQWGMDLKESTNADLASRESFLSTSLQSLINNLKDGDPNKLQLAQAAEALATSKLKNGGTLATHQKYGTKTHELRRLAANVIATNNHNNAVAQRVNELKARVINGEDISEDVEGVETPLYGRNGLKATPKQILDAVARDRDTALLSSPGGGTAELSTAEQMTRLVIGQKAGLPSPLLKDTFKGVGLDPTNPKFHKAVEAFRSLQAHSPSSIRTYMNARTEKLMTQMLLLEEVTGIPVEQAAEQIMQLRQEDPTGKFSKHLTKDFKKVRDAWRKDMVAKNVPKPIVEDVEEAFELINANAMDLDKESVRQRLDDIAGKYIERFPIFGGKRVKIPDGAVSAESWTRKMRIFAGREDGFFKKMNIDPTEVSLVRVPGLNGYAVYKDGFRVKTPGGSRAFIPDSKIEQGYKFHAEESRQAKLDKMNAAREAEKTKQKEGNESNPYSIYEDLGEGTTVEERLREDAASREARKEDERRDNEQWEFFKEYGF